ncbi:hypothetical protein HNP40_001224 [Mycobacteroides chelonae]|nr:hypothetical protein [Mycobacteroides chelonae]
MTITGAKSGIERLTPLGCFEHGGRTFIVRSNGGQEGPPSRVFNLRVNLRCCCARAGFDRA